MPYIIIAILSVIIVFLFFSVIALSKKIAEIINALNKYGEWCQDVLKIIEMLDKRTKWEDGIDKEIINSLKENR